MPDPASASLSSPSLPSASASSPMSPSELPTLPKLTAPPSAPTDTVPGDVLAGRITALADLCTEVTTDDGVVWSLVGDPKVALAVGDTATARITELGADELACGTGKSARLVAIRVVG